MTAADVQSANMLIVVIVVAIATAVGIIAWVNKDSHHK